MSELSVLEKKRLAATPERRAELQAQLLTAIETLLGDGASYPEISVERLIRAAGISRQTFYVYFDDKADLLDRLADDVVAELVANSWEFWLLSSEPSRDALLERMAPAVALYRKHELLLTALADVAGSNARAREAQSHPHIRRRCAGRRDP